MMRSVIVCWVALPLISDAASVLSRDAGGKAGAAGREDPAPTTKQESILLMQPPAEDTERMRLEEGQAKLDILVSEIAAVLALLASCG